MNKFIAELIWPSCIGYTCRHYNWSGKWRRQQQQHQENEKQNFIKRQRPPPVTLLTTIVAAISIMILLSNIKINHSTYSNTPPSQRWNTFYRKNINCSLFLFSNNLETIVQTHSLKVHCQSFSTSSISAIVIFSLSIATIGNVLSCCNTQVGTFSSFFSKKCAILPMRFSLGILIFLLVQMPSAVQPLASVTGIKLRSEVASQIRRRITDNTTYNAILNGETSLPCNITAPSLDDSATLVLWYRDDIASPIYTVDARTTATLDMGRHFPETDLFGARASFNLSYPLSFLRIKPVKATDSGDYRCRVDFRRARTVNRILKLTVIVPTTEVKIYDPKHREILGSTAGPFDEGTNVILICDSDKGIPLPAVHWWRGSQQLTSDYIVVNNSIVRNIITLTNISRDDLLITLTCRAHNTNLAAPVTKSVTLDLNLKPREIRIITPATNITAGDSQSIELACQSSGSKPPAKILWFRGGEPLTAITESISADGGTTTSFVSFVPSIEFNGKEIVCKAQNLAMSNNISGSSIQDKWPVNIYYPPMLALIMGSDSRSGDIVEGANVYFECDVKSNPPVSHIQWRLNGHLLELLSVNESITNISPESNRNSEVSQDNSHTLTRDIEIRNGTLRIGNVRHRHFGHYQCTATNLLASSNSETVFLNVKYAPRCSNLNWTSKGTPGLNDLPVFGVAIGEQITIECEVAANPEEVVFEWSFNHSFPISANALKFTSAGIRSVAQFSPLVDADFGTLFCNARNTVGTQRTPCAYRLVKAEPPSSPHNCTIVNKTSNSLTLECLPGHSGGLEQQYHLQAYTVNPNKLLKTLHTENWPKFTLQELPSGYVFKLIIFASNRRGRSNAIEITGSTTEPSPWKSAEYGIVDGPALSVSPILIVSLLALLLLCTIVVLFSKIRIKLRRRSNEKVYATMNSFTNTTQLNGSNKLNNNTTTTPLKSIMKKKSSHDNLLELASYVELHPDPTLLSTAAIELCTDGHLIETYGQSDNDASQPSNTTTETTGNLCTVNVLSLPYYVPSLGDYGITSSSALLSSPPSTGIVSLSSTPMTASSGCTINSPNSVTVSGVENQLQTFLPLSHSLISNHHSHSLAQHSHNCHHQQIHHHNIGEYPTELPILNIVNNNTSTMGVSGCNAITE